jgi:hypothetical protein
MSIEDKVLVFAAGAKSSQRYNELSEVILDLTFDEFLTPSQRTISCPKEGDYVVCCARITYPACHRTEPCCRVGIIRWKKQTGCCVVEHANGEEHVISYANAVNLKPAPVDPDNHNHIVELSRAVRGEVTHGC